MNLYIKLIIAFLIFSQSLLGQQSIKDSLIMELKRKSLVYDSLFQAFQSQNKGLITEIEFLGNAIAKEEEKTLQSATNVMTKISVDQEMHHFGTIKDGTVVAHVFTIRNIGAYPLYIKDVKTTCGCTVPEWPKEPIEPGKSAEIKVTFNSEGKGLPGGLEMVKKVTIIANTDPAETYLSMRGFVKK